MKSLLLASVFVLLVALFYWPSRLPSPPQTATTSQLFEAWCKQHGKSYSSHQEKQYRLSVFEKNLAFINQHNLENHTYTLALNLFADLTNQEFRVTHLGFSPPEFLRLNRESNPKPRAGVGDDIPLSKDWRALGAVTDVKDQLDCGSCWAFSTTGAIEGVNAIVTGSLISLSEQELVECDSYPNRGCNGGWMTKAYQFVIDNNGIDTEEDYPYKGWKWTWWNWWSYFINPCNKERLKRNVVTIDGYAEVPPNDEFELLQAVYSQPVSAGVSASGIHFQFYEKGTFDAPCSTSLDHAVLIVGYDTDHWIVKNSWGKSWGMDGYIHIFRNDSNPEGVCGINKLLSFPKKTGPNPPLPPPTPPDPVYCNLFSYCVGKETCCCENWFLGICFGYMCCEGASAVCCEDQIHSCTPDYPICDPEGKYCFKANGNSTIKASECRLTRGIIS